MQNAVHGKFEQNKSLSFQEEHGIHHFELQTTMSFRQPALSETNTRNLHTASTKGGASVACRRTVRALPTLDENAEELEFMIRTA